MFSQVTNEFITNTIENKGSIRRSIPKNYNSIQRYVLRMVQFYSGINSHMPMSADYDLADFCKDNGIEFRYAGEASRLIRKNIDDIIFDYCKTTGLIGGIVRWGKVLGTIK